MMSIAGLQQEENAPEAGGSAAADAVGKAPGAFRTISEVAEELGLQQHVLRFWETKFSQIRPLKRGGGRRYYRPQDVALIRKIHHLLYTEGYTIRGAQKLLKGQGRNQIAVSEFQKQVAPPLEQGRDESLERDETTVSHQPSSPLLAAIQPPSGLTRRQRVILESMLGELKELRNMIRGETV